MLVTKEKIHMGIFGDISKKISGDYILQNFVVGYPEAEAESGSNAVNILDVFDDFLHVFPSLNNGKFIIVGRKGSGKTAIAEYLHAQAKNCPTAFSSILKMSDVKIHELIQSNLHAPIDKRLIIRWVLYINFINLLLTDEKLLSSNDQLIKELNRFMKYNSGMCRIDDYVIKSFSEKGELNLKSPGIIAKIATKVGFDINKAKPSYVELLGVLQKTLSTLLSDIKIITDKNEYILIIDDLDLGVSIKDEISLTILNELLREARDINNLFNGKLKVILLLRQDICKQMLHVSADSAKILDSYAIILNWYSHETYRVSENNIPLKAMINKRLAYCFERCKLSYNKHDPWQTLFSQDCSVQNRSSFEIVLRSSLFRPRDLLLFFKNISEYDCKLPIEKDIFDKMLLDLADGLFAEFSNELSLFYSKSEIEKIESILKHLAYNNPIFDNTYFYTYISKHYPNDFEDQIKLLERLFEYSIIGNYSEKKVFFYHRDEQINMNEKFCLIPPIKNHFCRTKLFY